MNIRPDPEGDFSGHYQDWQAPYQDADPQDDGPQSNPIAGLVRIMRGRWLLWLSLCFLFAAILATSGYLSGEKTYESRAILRIYPKEPSILYASRDDSVLKTYESYVKAETTFVASHEVMSRAANRLRDEFPEIAQDMTVGDLTGSVSIRRAETLIILETSSKSPEFAAAKLNAVTDAYLSLTAENKSKQSDLRSTELTRREAELLSMLKGIDARLLEVGGEYGSNALLKAHIEKITQIDALASRRTDVEQTLSALRETGGEASADMNDEHILRATLLDRGLADLNIELARHEADLATLLQRYTNDSPAVRDKRERVAIIQQAMDDRRTQIQVLGQTGALTDQNDNSDENSTQVIENLLVKLTKELEAARSEARDLNARRVELSFLDEERVETRRMLDETRVALDIIRVESQNSLPGLTDLMSPAVVPDGVAEDTAKIQAMAGVAGGGLIGTMLVLGIGLIGKSIRYSDEVAKADSDVETLAVLSSRNIKNSSEFSISIDRLRNTLQLLPARLSSAPAQESGRVLSVCRLSEEGPEVLSRALAESFARTSLRVLYIDADISGEDADCSGSLERGWRDVLSGQKSEPVRDGSLDVLPKGSSDLICDGGVSLLAIRKSLTAFSNAYDVVIVNAGSLAESVSTELIVSASDLAIFDVTPGDDIRAVKLGIERLKRRPRYAAGVVFRNARGNDPELTISTSKTAR